MEGAVAFGIVGGTAENPVVSYLTEPQPVTPELLALATPVRPTEVFRFGAPCAEGGCQHFDGATCQLGRKLVQNVSPAVDRLPPCRLRPSCRWWHERGRAACLRCPLVVTTHYHPNVALREAADPSARAVSEEELGREQGPSVSLQSAPREPSAAREGAPAGT